MDLELSCRSFLLTDYVHDSRESFYCRISSIPTEKRLMIDITTLHQAFDKNHMSSIRWQRSVQDVADVIIEPGDCAPLERFVSTGRLA